MVLAQDFSKKDLDDFKSLIEHMRKLTSKKVNSFHEKYIINQLDYSLKYFGCFSLDFEPTLIYRLSINREIIKKNKLIGYINHLKYPPIEKVFNVGRCNLRHQSVLYAGFNFVTILGEMRPKPGEIVTQSEWKLKDGMKLRVFPVCKKQPKPDYYEIPRTSAFNKPNLYFEELFDKHLETLPPVKKDYAIFLMDFLSDVFSSKVERDSPSNYILSAYFSDYIFNKVAENVDAIIYPSVKSFKYMMSNIAIKKGCFDEKFELKVVRDSIVTYPGNIFLTLGECQSFDFASGKILRSSNYRYGSPPGEKFRVVMNTASDADFSLPF